jgi:hypothetical protein
MHMRHLDADPTAEKIHMMGASSHGITRLISRHALVLSMLLYVCLEVVWIFGLNFSPRHIGCLDTN